MASKVQYKSKKTGTVVTYSQPQPRLEKLVKDGKYKRVSSGSTAKKQTSGSSSSS